MRISGLHDLHHDTHGMIAAAEAGYPLVTLIGVPDGSSKPLSAEPVFQNYIKQDLHKLRGIGSQGLLLDGSVAPARGAAPAMAYASMRM